MNAITDTKTTLILGGTGKTGRRVAERLLRRGLPIRIGSRTAKLPFDWDDQSSWGPALENVDAVYISYYPDLAVPAAVEAVRAFSALALESGVRRLVLLSGRGEEAAERAEQVVRDCGIEWTILRASWFAQNFSESFLLDAVLAGHIALPAGAIREPFIDVEDIADVALAALTEDHHGGQRYELTGPRLMTFAEVAEAIGSASGRSLSYSEIPPEQYAALLKQHNVPADFIELVMYLFTTVLDGRNAHLSDGVQRALGREPRDFRDYAHAAAQSGIWDVDQVA